MAAVTNHSDFGAQEKKIHHRFHFPHFYLPWSNGVKVETVTYFIFLGSKITADSDYSHEIKYAFSLEEKL